MMSAKQKLNTLPDDALEQIKKYIAKNPPPHLNLFDVIYFQYINRLNTKELVKFCKDNKIKQSNHGNTNQYIKRANIIRKYLGRELKIEDELVITFTRGIEHCNRRDLSLDEE